MKKVYNLLLYLYYFACAINKRIQGQTAISSKNMSPRKKFEIILEPALRLINDFSLYIVLLKIQLLIKLINNDY